MNIEHKDSDYVDISHMWGENLYHWMFDVACDLFWLQESGVELSGKTTIIHNEVIRSTKYFNFTLGLFGIDKHIVYKGETGIRIEYSNRFGGLADKSTTLAWNTVATKQVRREKKILIQRATRGREETVSRNLVNRDLICKRLGLEMVFMEDLTFKEQIDLVSSCSLILAVHGAALALTSFCAPGTKIVEIKSPIARGGMYKQIAGNLDLDYQEIPGTAIGTDHANHALSIDLKDLEKLL